MKHPGGRPAVMMPCGWCGEEVSISAMRAHATTCKDRPNATEVPILEDSQVYGYVMQGADTKNFKVGVAKNLNSRRSSYRMHSAEPVDLVFLCVLASKKSAITWESSVIGGYKSHALHGEWLKGSCGLQTEIEKRTVGGLTGIDIPAYRPRREGGFGEGYTKSVLIRIKPSQLEQFQRHAKLTGKSVSEWLRDLGAAEVSGPTLSREDPILKEMIQEGKAEFVSSKLTPELETLSDQIAERAMEALGFKKRESSEYQEKSADGISEMGRKPNIVRNMAAELAASIPGLRVGLGPSHVFTDPEIPKALEQLAAMNPPATFFEDRYRDEVGTDPLPKIFFPGDTPEEPVRSWAEEFARCRKLGDFGAEAFAEATEHIKKWPKGFKNWNEQKQVAWLDANYPLDGR